MQTNHWSVHPVHPGKFGLPSSPACTRPRRDVAFIEGHSRAQSQPMVFAPIRPLRLHRTMTSKSVSVPTGAAPGHTQKFTPRSEPRSAGTTFAARSKKLTRESSTSESSISSSSVQGGMKGALSQRSSFTSLEDESEQPKKYIDPDRSLQTNSPLRLHPRKVFQHGRYLSISEDGDSVWDRVAAAASILKVNVGRAWTSTINTSEEETSPGGDSHLVRVMKAYHLAKARHPSDLPDWLFGERQRKPSTGSRFVESPRGAVPGGQPPSTSPRPIYNEVASRAPHANHSRIASHVLPSSDGTRPSKAADRLKAFRNAKHADFGVRHISSKSESLSYSPSRVHTIVDARRDVDHQGTLSFPTRQPLRSVQQLRPGAF